MGVLAGVRVLDFGRYIAGPYCAALLAEFGAEVIRIEKREGSEDRFVAPLGPELEGALFSQMNRNKLSVTLDPMHPDGRRVVHRLVESADVVIANLPRKSLVAMGLDDDALRRIRPDIILASTSAYGETGPFRDQVGFDGVGQVMSGAVHLTGRADQPYRSAVAWVDFGTALHSALGVVLALLHRRQTGEGQTVSASLLGTALAFMSPTLIEEAVIAPGREAIGNRSHGSGPTDIFRTQDGWILTQVIGQPLFRRWADLMGEPEWLEDPRFATDQSRGEHGAIISARMAQWCAGRTREDALMRLAEARVPAAPVLAPRDVLLHPQVAAMEMLVPLHAVGAPEATPVFRVPLGLTETPGVIARPPPRLGEHTDAVLGELGFAQAEIDALRAAGAI